MQDLAAGKPAAATALHVEILCDLLRPPRALMRTSVLFWDIPWEPLVLV